MNAIRQLFLSAALPLAALACYPLLHAAEPPVNIIFDTDTGADSDDAGAHFMLHGAIKCEEITLLATIGCTSSEFIAPCIDAVNTRFGRPEIPLATLKDSGFMPNRSINLP